MAASLCALFAAAPSVLAQVSPGRMSQAHAELEGATECFKCHGRGVGSERVDELCLDCHTGIRWNVARGLGFHGREAGSTCARCHPEHAGVDFELIHWEAGPEKFDHEQAGWPLQGKHATVRCRDCHKEQFQRSGVMPLLKNERPSSSWLGLERECLSCHVDRHRGTLGNDCTKCHEHDAWKPAPHFLHDDSTFPLLGKHVDVACNKCHLVPGRIERVGDDGTSIAKYKPVPHGECSDCHKDQHEGRLGPRCSGCHNPAGFTQIDRRSFDHSRTRFPLRGAHATAECVKCHDPNTAWGKKPAFQTCETCHTDVHAGQALRKAQKVDCGSCHQETKFKPSIYTVEQHQDSPFRLLGKHAQVACDKCHPQSPPGVDPGTLGQAEVLIRRAHEVCRDCHVDSHAGQLAERKDGGACESCHRVEGFVPSTYTVEQHAETDLPLDGRHREVECSACHAEERKGLPAFPDVETLGKARVALTRVDPACHSCHFDPHSGRFAAGGERQMDRSCRACHEMRAFRPSLVDAARHDQFPYKLDGAHRAVPCVLCHAELKTVPPSIRLLAVEGRARELPFRSKHERCEDCHRNPHGDQFAQRRDAGRCDACHELETFKPAPRFDHDRDSEFPLSGAHREVDCAKCHPPRRRDDGNVAVHYRPIPHRCQDCHGRSPC